MRISQYNSPNNWKNSKINLLLNKTTFKSLLNKATMSSSALRRLIPLLNLSRPIPKLCLCMRHRLISLFLSTFATAFKSHEDPSALDSGIVAQLVADIAHLKKVPATAVYETTVRNHLGPEIGVAENWWTFA